MGYTALPSKILIGLGASSISDVYYAYAQNEKGIHKYQNQLAKDEWTIQKAHVLSDQDLQNRAVILDLICRKKAEISSELWENLSSKQLELLVEMEQDGLISISSPMVSITELGMSFIRNICKQFDVRMASKKSANSLFSKTI